MFSHFIGWSICTRAYYPLPPLPCLLLLPAPFLSLLRLSSCPPPPQGMALRTWANQARSLALPLGVGSGKESRALTSLRVSRRRTDICAARAQGPSGNSWNGGAARAAVAGEAAAETEEVEASASFRASALISDKDQVSLRTH